MILSVTLNPCVDRAMFFDKIVLNDTNRAIRTERDAGGKGVNVSRIIARLGGRTTACGFIGGGTGDVVTKKLGADGVTVAFTIIEGETRENISIEDASVKAPTTFNDPGPIILPSEAERFLEDLVGLLGVASWITIGGSNPRGLPESYIREIIGRAKSLGVKVSVDADGAVLKEAIAEKPQFVKPNRREAERLLGRELLTTDSVVLASRDVLELLDPGEHSFCVISLGESGAVLSSRQGTFVGGCADVEVRSTVGCGDSLVGGVLWALEEGLDYREALCWGIAAGAATAASDGNDIGTAEVARAVYETISIEKK